jgi:hypothetical protein
MPAMFEIGWESSFCFRQFFLGSYILLLGGTVMLPLERGDCMDAFQIVVPLFVAQLTIIFRFLGGDSGIDAKVNVPVPRWAVVGPPTAVSIVLALTIVALIIGSLSEEADALIGAGTFKAVVTFCVSVLNATTIFIVAKYFQTDAKVPK